MSASDREKAFSDFEKAIEEENSAAIAMSEANQRYNTARDAASAARTTLDGLVAQSADAALHGQLDPVDQGAPPAPAPVPVQDPVAV